MLGEGILFLIAYRFLEAAFLETHSQRERNTLKIKAGGVDAHVKLCERCQDTLEEIISKEAEDCLPRDFLDLARAYQVINHYPQSLSTDFIAHLLECRECQERSVSRYHMGIYSDFVD